MKKTILVLGCCLLGWGANLFAQQGVIPAGGESTGTGGKVSYSIGQVDYISVPSISDGTITQGLQQPFEILIYDGIEETGINLTTSVFPNPTMQSLTLRIEGNLLADLIYQLYDEQGKLIMNSKIENAETKIDMSQLAAAKYFLKVQNNTKELKTFKIIKLN